MWKGKGRKSAWRFFVLIGFLLLTMLGALSVGSAQIGVGKSVRILLSNFAFVQGEYLKADVSNMQQYIIMKVRFPRVLLSVLVGGALSAVGSVFQGLFGNPLADPHILGASSGAAIGATIAILCGLTFGAAGMGAISVCAFVGALASIVLVCVVAGKGRSVIMILLTGTAISTLLSSVISLLMMLNRDDAERIYLWTLGSFSAATWVKVAWMAGIALICMLVLFYYAKDLNLMAMGEETAGSLGVETTRVRWILILVDSLLVAAAVSVSGMIGFVGLVIPHCMRFLFGDDYRKLLPAAYLGGGIFLLLCDTVARTLIAPGELPVGVVTAVIGAPYFIYLIKRNGK